jgi:hypothetical protein
VSEPSVPTTIDANTNRDPPQTSFVMAITMPASTKTAMTT